MKTEIKTLIAKQDAGTILSTDEIRTLMLYAIDVLRAAREGRTI